MDVKKTIAELTSQVSEITYDSDEDNVLLKGVNIDDTQHSSEEGNDYDDVEPSNLRKTNDSLILPGQTYGGKTTSRKKTYSLSESSDYEDTQDIIGDKCLDSDKGEENDTEGEDATEDENSSGMEEAVSFENKKRKNSQSKMVDCNIYSAGSKNISNDLKKGAAIRNQLRIWESLLECRIKLQKGLAACNSLPPCESLLTMRMQLDSESQQKINNCSKSLLVLLEKMVDLQAEMLKQCSEFKKNQELDLNEEIPSDQSEDENNEEEDNEKDQPLKKKRRLNEYSLLLKEAHVKLLPFRNSSIQKWNDKTKVSTGKMANSNFAAFDQSTLKQIEQIMADKIRLVNRTRIKRNECYSLKNQQGLSPDTQETTLDAEIFDDSDFYHKLLRDYIERKSVDVANSSHTERQMIELQKLRSKMKKNVDTKSTKGRKLRYVVLPKLVNFMAPHTNTTWSEQAETELYNSLFGKIKVNF